MPSVECVLFPSRSQRTVPVSDPMNIVVINSALFTRHLTLVSWSSWLPLNIVTDPDDVLTDLLNPDGFYSLPKMILHCQNSVLLLPMHLRVQNICG